MKLGLRVWIALTTVLGFLAGWVVVAHNAPTAALTATRQPAASTPAPTSSFDSSSALGGTSSAGSQSQAQSVQSFPAQRFGRSTPRLRTGGS